ncbi:hypothetical protein A6A27_36740 [Micromonospora sp. CB01531]|nr:hypothetical protein A6A27_36740 [Micromonospora sp. CB01531]
MVGGAVQEPLHPRGQFVAVGGVAGEDHVGGAAIAIAQIALVHHHADRVGRGVHRGGRERVRVDVVGSHLGGARLGRGDGDGDGNQTRAGRHVDHPPADHHLRMVQGVPGEGRATGPGVRPERREPRPYPRV